MNLILIGNVEFTRVCLDEIIRNRFPLQAVITRSREDSAFNRDYADLGPLARENGIPVLYAKNTGDSDLLAQVTQMSPDVILVCGFSYLIPEELIASARLAAIGSHPALLPLNRGRHPLIWTLVDGLEQGGLTFFCLEKVADAGDIVWQKSFRIGFEDDAKDLYDRICELARQAIRELVPGFIQGIVPRRPQDHSQATVRRKRSEADGEIQWQKPWKDSYNLIRALARPYVGAHTFLGADRVIVWRSKPLNGQASNPPGTIVRIEEQRFVVATSDGLLEIVEYEGNVRLKVGDVLGREIK